jgi:hypothetical protein
MKTCVSPHKATNATETGGLGSRLCAQGREVGSRVPFSASAASVIEPRRRSVSNYPQIGQFRHLTTRSALLRIECMFDIGSPAAASPSGASGRDQSPPAKR